MFQCQLRNLKKKALKLFSIAIRLMFSIPHYSKPFFFIVNVWFRTCFTSNGTEKFGLDLF